MKRELAERVEAVAIAVVEGAACGFREDKLFARIDVAQSTVSCCREYAGNLYHVGLDLKDRGVT